MKAADVRFEDEKGDQICFLAIGKEEFVDQVVRELTVEHDDCTETPLEKITGSNDDFGSNVLAWIREAMKH